MLKKFQIKKSNRENPPSCSYHRRFLKTQIILVFSLFFMLRDISRRVASCLKYSSNKRTFFSITSISIKSQSIHQACQRRRPFHDPSKTYLNYSTMSGPEVDVINGSIPIGSDVLAVETNGSNSKKRASSNTPEPQVQPMSKNVNGDSNRPDRPPRVSSGPKKPKAKRFKEPPAADPTSNEGVLIQDIKSMLKEQEIEEDTVVNDLREFFTRPRGTVHPEHRTVTATISRLSGGGDGIGLVKENENETEANNKRTQVVIVPYTLVGETVECKIYKTQKYYFEAELLQILEASPKRDNSLVKCQYFGKCSGCQYQMIPYQDQLEIKRNVIVNAYKHNSNLDPALIPAILDTAPSPEQYYYRTKLTPHFDVPRSGGKSLAVAPPVGFGERGRKSVIDIEECAIGTPIINKGLTTQRAMLKENFKTYKKGATILLRENFKEPQVSTEEGETSSDVTEGHKVCCTSTKEIITEYVGKYKFTYASSSFFQNNNSILEDVTSYVRDNLKIPATGLPPQHLVDTYCGCGLFGITCAGAAESVIGVEISKDSVLFARKNAELNNLKNAEFIVGNAERIFENVKTDPATTAIIIDPPRKGCDEPFLEQLLKFLPAKIVYVSCNVHSQARDIGYLLNSERGAKYTIESIRGFDFFPQTHHVESVAVLALNP